MIDDHVVAISITRISRRRNPAISGGINGRTLGRSKVDPRMHAGVTENWMAAHRDKLQAVMLGVPATLLNPAGGESDTGGGSVLEGFTLLPALVQLMMSRQASALAVQFEPAVHDAVLTAVPFHPPV